MHQFGVFTLAVLEKSEHKKGFRIQRKTRESVIESEKSRKIRETKRAVDCGLVVICYVFGL